MYDFSALTRNIKVSARSHYIRDRSDPKRNYYFFSYDIEIENIGNNSVQLISRNWIITDATGKTEQVKGPGVIGEQPTLNKGEIFNYTSFCPLATPFGTMKGSYQMVTQDGDSFDATIPSFKLVHPFAVN